MSFKSRLQLVWLLPAVLVSLGGCLDKSPVAPELPQVDPEEGLPATTSDRSTWDTWNITSVNVAIDHNLPEVCKLAPLTSPNLGHARVYGTLSAHAPGHKTTSFSYSTELGAQLQLECNLFTFIVYDIYSYDNINWATGKLVGGAIDSSCNFSAAPQTYTNRDNVILEHQGLSIYAKATVPAYKQGGSLYYNCRRGF